MDSLRSCLFLVSFFSLIACTLVLAATTGKKQIYIVYLGGVQESVSGILAEQHNDLLSLALGSLEEGTQSVVYNYKHSFNGFAASLSEKQAKLLSEMPQVVSVFPNTLLSLHTTRSWDFLGDEIASVADPWQQSKVSLGQDVIVGVLDTGVWPESASYKDDGYPVIPSKWKGSCQSGTNFSSTLCNRKLIGAKYFLKGYEAAFGHVSNNDTDEYRSPRDKNGHGTHTSSTAAGGYVPNANIFGYANGTARGGAPLARLAVYKVCWTGGCFTADVLAAMDEAISDGVDVLSLSIGGQSSRYLSDGIAIGAFHAVSKGVVVACSAGNSGPSEGSVGNVSPWIITVAANTVDREFPSDVVLGDGTHLKGKSIAPYSLEDLEYPLIYGGNAAADVNDTESAGQCLPDSLDSSKVKGKVVLCFRGTGTRVGKGLEVQRAGGAAILLGNSVTQGNDVTVDAYVLPGAALGFGDATIAQLYANSTKNPVVKIPPSTTVLNSKPAPMVAAFSSRGPNTITTEILKPDLTAPGVNILAAWTEANSPTELEADKRRVQYNIISGTSMSCPHVGGLAALVKSAHPSWSPSAIKSALMTTATVIDNTNSAITDGDSGGSAGPFSMGAGQVNPTAALDPGLVYDAGPSDYFLFLCAVGYDSSSISRSTGFNATCPAKTPSPTDLNYPSISLVILSKNTTIVPRTVTNVGSDSSTYNATLVAPPGVKIEVVPSLLQFTKTGERQSFEVKFSLQKVSPAQTALFGSLTWSDGQHNVRSPIVINF